MPRDSVVSFEVVYAVHQASPSSWAFCIDRVTTTPKHVLTEHFYNTQDNMSTNFSA